VVRWFDAMLRAKGWLAMGGQIVDATVTEAGAALENANYGHARKPLNDRR
jgi:hypothetical protein